MAGSIRKFSYTSDDGTVYKVERDESNTETLNGLIGADAIPPSGVGSLPKGYAPRYALLYQVANPQIKRTIAVLAPATFAALSGATDFALAVVGGAPVPFRISSLIGERREGLTNADTGQTDGD